MSISTPTNGEKLPMVERLAQQNGRKASLFKSPRLSEQLIFGFLFFCGALSIFTTLGFTFVLGRESLHIFTEFSPLELNRTLEEDINTTQTTLTISEGGTPLQVGNFIMFTNKGVSAIAAQTDTEIMEVVALIDRETVEVVRGARGSTPVAYAANTHLYGAGEVSIPEFLFGTDWAPQIGRFGILELLIPTVVITVIAMFIAIPLGMGAAIYLSEYATRRVRGILKPMVEILAGVPTVVYGYFALTFVTPLLRSVLGADTVEVYNMLSAGIVVGVLIIPTIASISEDAIQAVPNSLREASYGLGATRLETVRKVLLPAALSGISAAIILGVSRAFGETMIVLIASGAGPNLTLNPLRGAETMAGHIARISTGDISQGSIDYNSIFAVGLTLFIVTLLLNFASTIITRRFREVYA
jgi:phosphate transport system permease protein